MTVGGANCASRKKYSKDMKQKLKSLI